MWYGRLGETAAPRPPAVSSIMLSIAALLVPVTPGARPQLRELHQGPCGPPVRTIGIGQRLAHFEMAVAVGLDELDRLARRLERGGEIAVLALKLRGFVGAVGD